MGSLRLDALLRRAGAGALSRLAWVLVGALLLYALLPQREWLYPEVIVPAARIIEREVPSGPPTIVERIRYVYLSPDVRAVAPGAVTEDVARFCRPTVVTTEVATDEPVPIARNDTVSHVPAPSLIRSVSYSPALLPFARGSLLVTSMDGYGDLVAEDYRTRAPFGIAAGIQEPYKTTVRQPRLALPTEVARGTLWYLTFRLAEAIFIHQ